MEILVVIELVDKNAKTKLQSAAVFKIEDGPYSAKAAIVIIRGEPIGRCYELTDKPLLIGRGADCDIELAEDSASRRHCQIWRDADRILIRDLGSTNKTCVNSVEIGEQQLRHGDLICVGDSVMKFVANELVAEFHAEIYNRSMIDPLTDLANRRFFDPALITAAKTAKNIGSHLSLAILDVDFFKRINDEFDHMFGDLVLQGVARMIGEVVEEGEIAARMGGEEFALLLPGCDLNRAEQRVLELCQRVSGHRFQHADQKVVVTLSVGIAAWNNTLRDGKVLLRAADRAMLKAKADGRNRVLLAES